MFKKKVSIEQKYLNEILNNDCMFNYKKLFISDDTEMSFKTAQKIINLITPEIFKKEICRSIYLRYIGFRDGDNNVDYSLQEFKIEKPEKADSIIFGEKIKDTFFIKEFLQVKDHHFDFLGYYYFNSDMLKELKNFHVHISDLNPNLDCFKKDFLEEHEEVEDGIRRNLCAGVGYEYMKFICNKDDVYYNLSIIYDFCNKFKQYLVLHEKFSIKFIPYFEDLNDIPYIFEHKKLLVDIIAFNKTLASKITSEMFIGNFSTKELIIDAIMLNSNCYCHINEYYKKDSDIIKLIIEKNIALLPFVIEYNNIDENNIKEKLIRTILKEKAQKESD